MLIIDDLLLGGFNFVLRRLADAVDSELSDDRVYREELLAAQMRLELGEITEEEFAEIEGDMLARIREVRERHGVSAPAVGSYSIEGADVSAVDGHENVPEPDSEERTPEAAPASSRRNRRRK
jgi:hypothetical protein